MNRAMKTFIRSLAQRCLWPWLRIQLYRWSGIIIGKRVFINMNCEFRDGPYERIIIDDEAAIGSFVSLLAVRSPSHSFIGRVQKSLLQRGTIHIKRGAWLGQSSIILPKVTIGIGAIIGANAVVTKDVPDFAIMVGIPAKQVGDVCDRKE